MTAIYFQKYKRGRNGGTRLLLRITGLDHGNFKVHYTTMLILFEIFLRRIQRKFKIYSNTT